MSARARRRSGRRGSRTPRAAARAHRRRGCRTKKRSSRGCSELVWADDADDVLGQESSCPGTTRTSDLVWWWRQRVNDLGPRHVVPAERRRAAARAQRRALGADPIIQPGDVLHCDVGITVARLNTDTQHLAYVLRAGRDRRARRASSRRSPTRTRCRTSRSRKFAPGRTGNEILQAVLAR